MFLSYQKIYLLNEDRGRFPVLMDEDKEPSPVIIVYRKINR